MPINEGVIFANNKNPSNVRLFFESYLASLTAEKNNEELGKIYTNIRRWRGGQLNQSCRGTQFYATSTALTEYGAKIALPTL